MNAHQSRETKVFIFQYLKDPVILFELRNVFKNLKYFSIFNKVKKKKKIRIEQNSEEMTY